MRLQRTREIERRDGIKERNAERERGRGVGKAPTMLFVLPLCNPQFKPPWCGRSCHSATGLTVVTLSNPPSPLCTWRPPPLSLSPRHMHECTHIPTHARTHARMHARTHTRTHTRTHEHTHARTHARTHTCAHTRVFWAAAIRKLVWDALRALPLSFSPAIHRRTDAAREGGGG